MSLFKEARLLYGIYRNVPWLVGHLTMKYPWLHILIVRKLFVYRETNTSCTYYCTPTTHLHPPIPITNCIMSLTLQSCPANADLHFEDANLGNKWWVLKQSTHQTKVFVCLARLLTHFKSHGTSAKRVSIRLTRVLIEKFHNNFAIITKRLSFGTNTNTCTSLSLSPSPPDLLFPCQFSNWSCTKNLGMYTHNSWLKLL